MSATKNTETKESEQEIVNTETMQTDRVENRRNQLVETNEGLLSLPPEYEPTTKAVFDKAGVVKAFAEGKFPTHTVEKRRNKSGFQAKIRNSPSKSRKGDGPSQTAYQYDDGSGVCYHYGTIAGIRTHNGLLLNNDQNWGVGYTLVAPIPTWARDASLPLTTLRNIIRGTEVDLYDITEVIEGDDAELVVFNHGEERVALAYDETANRGDGRLGFLLTEEERSFVGDNPDLVYGLLLPAGINGEIDSAANVHKNRSTYPHAEHDAPIHRQGEYFLVPRPGFKPLDPENFPKLTDYSDTDGLEKPLQNARRIGDRWSNHHKLGSHLPRDFVELYDGRMFVRGTFRHTRREHGMVNLGETWHEVFESTREVTVIGDRSGLSD